MADCEFELTNDQLDELFVKEVDSVITLIFEVTDRDKILPTCIRWFQIFQQSTAKEKFARNWMLLEMHKQLNDRKTLGYPFTDAKYCHSNLHMLHQMCMDNKCSSDDVDNSKIIDKEDCPSNHSHRLNDSREDAYQQLIDENAALVTELEKHQQKYEHLQRHQQRNTKIRKSLTEKNTYFDKELGCMKQIFCRSAISSTKFLNTIQLPTIKSQYFATLFSVLCETKEDENVLTELDNKFEELIHSQIDNYLRDQRDPIVQKISKDYDTLRAKVSQRYKNVLRLQQAAQEKELSLMAMRYLTLLRKLFLGSFMGSNTTKKAALKFLEERYSEMNQDT